MNNRISVLLLAAALMLGSCNKDPEAIPYNPPVQPTGPTLAEALQASPDDSLFYRLIVRGNMEQAISSRTNYFTMFVPNNAAMKQFIVAASGGQVPANAPDAVFSAFISTYISRATAAGIVSYNTIPDTVPASALPSTFPNLEYPTIINPAPTVSPLIRLTTFVSGRNGAWVNNIPVTVPNRRVANGIIHNIAAMNVPPTQYLWDRISSDADLTILKAAIERADSAGPQFVPILQQFGPNFTVFAPTNQAFKQLISYLSGGAIPVGAPDAVFIGFMGSNYVTTQLVSGLLAYHVMDGRDGRPGRSFLNNFPAATEEYYKTLLNSIPAAAAHPGVALKVSLAPTGITGATVKGWANATASNITYNPLPNGTSDQRYLNGVLHKIDQVLLPQ